MSQNPYESPRVEPQVLGVLSGRREDLRKVALYQKGILVCILIYLLAIVFQFAMPPEFQIFLGIGILALGLVGTVFVFLLAVKIHGLLVGILLGVLTFVPCLGLLALLVVNGNATKTLTQNGIKVGLLGANLSEI